MKRFAILLVVLGIGAIVLIAVVVVILVLEDRAATQAREFCSRFAEGSAFAEVQRAAASEGEPAYRSIKEGEVSVAFVGVPPFSRHFCIVEGSAGRVTARRVMHLD